MTDIVVASIISTLLQGFIFSSRRRHTRSLCDWSSDVCSSDLVVITIEPGRAFGTGQHASTLGCLERLESLIARAEIGRASCRERGKISEGAVLLEKNTNRVYSSCDQCGS